MIIVNGNNRMRTIVGALVATVWTITALTTLYTADYTPLGIVTPVMIIVVSFLYGFKVERQKLDPPPPDKEPPTETPHSKDLSDW